MRNHIKAVCVVALLWLTASCSNSGKKYNWYVTEYSKVQAFDFGGTYNHPDTTYKVEGKTEIEILDMEADLMAQSTGKTLHFMEYEKIGNTPSPKGRRSNWALTVTRYQREEANGDTADVLSVREKVELIENSTRGSALTEAYLKRSNNTLADIVVTSARLRELSDEEYKNMKAQGDTGWKKIK